MIGKRLCGFRKIVKRNQCLGSIDKSRRWSGLHAVVEKFIRKGDLGPLINGSENKIVEVFCASSFCRGKLFDIRDGKKPCKTTLLQFGQESIDVKISD